VSDRQTGGKEEEMRGGEFGKAESGADMAREEKM